MRFERKSTLTLVFHALGAVFFFIVGISLVITGHLSHRGRSFGGGAFSARAMGIAFMLASLAWLRAVWLQRGGRFLDVDDGLLKYLVLLAVVVAAAILPLLFFDVTT
ncbi:MAG: hypothetical protein K2Y21_11585 [Phycisphaerales bacterium]|nr:hypothetical protein [Phycisphaerales bacterium]